MRRRGDLGESLAGTRTARGAMDEDRTVTSHSPLAVTGSTGRLGGRDRPPARRGRCAQRLVVRDPRGRRGCPAASAVAAPRTTSGTPCAPRSRASTRADGVGRGDAPTGSAQHRTFVDAAAEAGVEHLVYISFFGAAPDATFTLARDHWATEEHIRAQRPARSPSCATTSTPTSCPLLVGDGRRDPRPGGRRAGRVRSPRTTSPTSPRRCCSTRTAHAGATYDLTGPRGADPRRGRRRSPRGHRPAGHATIAETLEEAYASRACYGAPDWQVDAWVSTYTAIAAGELARVSTAVADLTGHPARTLAEVLRAG